MNILQRLAYHTGLLYPQMRIFKGAIVLPIINQANAVMGQVCISLSQVLYEGVLLDVEILWCQSHGGQILRSTNPGRDAVFLDSVAKHFDVSGALGIEDDFPVLWLEIFVPVNATGELVVASYEAELPVQLLSWDTVSEVVYRSIVFGQDPMVIVEELDGITLFDT